MKKVLSSTFLKRELLDSSTYSYFHCGRLLGLSKKIAADPEYVSFGESGARAQKVFVWGNADHGALGELKIRSRKARIQMLHRPVKKIFRYSDEVVDVACGFGFSLFALRNAPVYKLYGCGINTDSQIGYHAPRRGHPLKCILSMVPISLPFKFKGTNIIKVSAGRAHSAVLTDKEGAFLFGNNSFGQCGRPICEGEDYVHNLEFTKIPKLEDKCITDVVCGQDHTIFITEEGRVYTCGLGADGQTGLGHYNVQWKPSLLEGEINGERIVKVSSTTDTVLALNDKGDVFGWGNSEYHQLLLPEVLQQCNVPVYIKLLKNIGKVVDIASGGTFSTLVNDKGEVYIWGYGVLGKGPAVSSSEIPIQIPEILFGCNMYRPESKVVQVVCGLTSMFAVTNYGDLYAWGYNKYGQLGLGHRDTQYFPFKVCLGGLIKKVCMGVDHSIAICRPFG